MGEAGKGGHPKAVDYFVIASPHQALTDAARVLYGDKPKSLDIVFPIDDLDQLFPQDYKAYKTNGLWCSGNGESARRWGPTGMIDVKCPCELLDTGECKPVATLNFMMPRLPGLGVWSYTTSGTHAIVGLNSELEMFQRAFGGLRGIEFKLVLEEQSVSRHVEGKGPQKTTIYVPRVTSERTLIEVVEFRRALGATTDPMLMLGAASDEPDDDPAPETPPSPQEPAETVAVTPIPAIAPITPPAPTPAPEGPLFETPQVRDTAEVLASALLVARDSPAIGLSTTMFNAYAAHKCGDSPSLEAARILLADVEDAATSPAKGGAFKAVATAMAKKYLQAHPVESGR